VHALLRALFDAPQPCPQAAVTGMVFGMLFGTHGACAGAQVPTDREVMEVLQRVRLGYLLTRHGEMQPGERGKMQPGERGRCLMQSHATARCSQVSVVAAA